MMQISWIFVAIALALVALTVSALIAPLLRREDGSLRGGTDLDIYKDQLAEIDRDLARGVLTPEEAERTRTEVSRRILAADASGAAEAGRTDGRARGAAALLSAVLVGLGTVWLYSEIGAPGIPDQPRAARIAAGDEARRTRIGQLEAEAQMDRRFAAPIQVTQEEMSAIEQARVILENRPDDLLGWSVLAPAEARLHNYGAAAAAQARVLALKGAEVTEQDRYLNIHYLFMAAEGEIGPDLQSLILQIAPTEDLRRQLFQALKIDARSVGHFIATSRAQEQLIALKGGEATPEDYAELLDYMVAGVDGYVSPEAETIAVRLLQQNPDFVPALYYAGRLYAQTDRPDRAFGLYRRVIELGDPDGLHRLQAEGEIEQIAWRAGIEYTPPAPALRGPSAEDMAAAEGMDEESRQAMIRGMVEGLSERLATEGGPVEEWARLITALSVLGETDRAAAILGEARGVFQDEASRAALDAAATQAGLTE